MHHLSRDMFDRLRTIDVAMMMGEKVAKLSHIITMATWKVLRSVETRSNDSVAHSLKNECKMGGLYLMSLLIC